MTSAPDTQTDVVIVGARCAGAATALLLARAGVRVTVLDRSHAGADTLSTHALMRTGVLQLHRWGLADDIRRAGVPPVTRTVFRYGTDETVVTIRPIPGVDALYAPRRTLLDRILIEAAQEAGADVHFDTTVTGVERDHAGKVSGVRAHTVNGDAFTVSAPLSVGADGLGSRFSRWVDAPTERAGAHAGAVIYAYVGGLDNRGYEWFYSPGVAAGVIPTNGDVSCVFVGMPDARFRQLHRNDIHTAFTTVLPEVSAELAARVRGGVVLPRLRSYPGIAGYQRRPWGAGWALVGDAACHRDPLSARGISDALRDAELLARAIIAGLGDRSAIRALECSLEGYRVVRNRLSHHLFSTTDAIASYAWDLDTIPELLRSLAAAQADEVTFLSELDAPSLTYASAERR
ncbi:MAG TPA: NAD(P)/FAD-dependent oxidoreductase [Acidimicrobiales bacterium]|nr:NAD(P)/FAD-dependent oxidoreductase [Acidimicrobiales bacterium]